MANFLILTVVIWSFGGTPVLWCANFDENDHLIWQKIYQIIENMFKLSFWPK